MFVHTSGVFAEHRSTQGSRLVERRCIKAEFAASRLPHESWTPRRSVGGDTSMRSINGTDTVMNKTRENPSGSTIYNCKLRLPTAGGRREGETSKALFGFNSTLSGGSLRGVLG